MVRTTNLQIRMGGWLLLLAPLPRPVAQRLPGTPPDPTLRGRPLCPLTVPRLRAVHPGPARSAARPQRVGSPPDAPHSSPCSYGSLQEASRGQRGPSLWRPTAPTPGLPPMGSPTPRWGRRPLCRCSGQVLPGLRGCPLALVPMLCPLSLVSVCPCAGEYFPPAPAPVCPVHTGPPLPGACSARRG